MLEMQNIYLDGWELQSWFVKRSYILNESLEGELSVHTSNRFWMVLLFFPIQFLFISHSWVLCSASFLLSHIIYEIPPIWSCPHPSEWGAGEIQASISLWVLLRWVILESDPAIPLQRVDCTQQVEGCCPYISCPLWGLGAHTTDGFTDDWAVVGNESLHRISAGPIMWQIT